MLLGRTGGRRIHLDRSELSTDLSVAEHLGKAVTWATLGADDEEATMVRGDLHRIRPWSTRSTPSARHRGRRGNGCALEETLDQCWDLLRQRRALRDSARTHRKPKFAARAPSSTTTVALD